MLQHVALNRFAGAAALNDILFLSLGCEETSGIGQSCLGEFLLLVRAATPPDKMHPGRLRSRAPGTRREGARYSPVQILILWIESLLLVTHKLQV